MFRVRIPMITSQPVYAPRAVRALSSSGSSGTLTARLIERKIHLARHHRELGAAGDRERRRCPWRAGS
jgi:hypothetical protein